MFSLFFPYPKESRGKSYSSVLGSTPRKMSNTWIIKEKLEQIKAEMQRLSERHALTRPERSDINISTVLYHCTEIW